MLKYTKDKVGTPVDKCPPPVVMEIDYDLVVVYYGLRFFGCRLYYGLRLLS